MRKFEVFRYLKKFGILVFLVAALGLAFTYWYTNNSQKYTATAVIRYTNSAIKNGRTPSGTKLDVNEIYSSAVVSQAMELLGDRGPLNIIRSRCNVEEIITEEQKKINEAIMDKGEEVTYFPDTYKVNLVVDGKYGEKYARNALDAILQSYCTYYTEEYVEQKLSLNPSDNVFKNGYDYYECIEILENDTDDMLEFLKRKKEDYPNFRSSKTGYSYADLYEIYAQFKDYLIPELYASVLKGPQVKDGVLLKNHIANEIALSEQSESVKREQRKKLGSLTEKYVENNAEFSATGNGTDAPESGHILNRVESVGEGVSSETTYDGLILKTVDIDKNIARERIDRNFKKDILEKLDFAEENESGTKSEHEYVEKLTKSYQEKLLKYYEIVNKTGKELNLAISADYLKMISTVRVYPAINTKIYLMMSLILFFVIGCLGAIVLGRVEDIVMYMLYTDKKTGLPNRDKLNIYISELSNTILPEDFTYIGIKLENLDELNSKYGYTAGDCALKDFSDIIKVMGDTDATVGYNGAGKYNVFFEKCNAKKAEVILRILREQVEIYNNAHKDYPIEFSAKTETSTDAGIYDIRELIQSSEKHTKKQNGEENKK